MATYGEVRTKFIARLRRRDVDTTLADGFLQDAITRIQRIIRVPALERGTTFIITTGTYPGSFAVPNDLLKLRELTHTAQDGIPRTLERRPLAFVQRLAAEDLGGYSKYYARQGSRIILAPYPLASEIVRIDYWAELDPESVAADVGILTTIAQDLIIFGALSYACDHFNDKRGPLFEQRFVQILSDLQGMADDDELSGSAAVQPGFLYPQDE